MKIDVSGKTAIITGSSAGIGLGCAKALAEAGAEIVLVARREDALQEAVAAINASTANATVRYVAADLSTAEGCKAVWQAEPRCDMLVNNLGVYEPKPFFDISDEDWRRLFDINVMAGMRLARAYLPGMQEHGWGRVVFISSVDGVDIPTDSLHYGVTKAAVLALSRGLAKIAGRSGVTVNAVLPGITKAEWVDKMLADAADQSGMSLEDAERRAVKKRYPTSIDGRAHEVGEVANLVAYLCSDLSSATTGAPIRAEGGIIDSIV